MDELTFILVLAGIGVVLLVAMFTYYKHQKKINDEIENFNHHSAAIDDVLLTNNGASKTAGSLAEHDLPGSFTASRKDDFDISEVSIVHNQPQSPAENVKAKPDETRPDETKPDERELVDGVYINSKRVIKVSNSASDVTINTTSASKEQQQSQTSETSSPDVVNQPKTSQPQEIKVIYDATPDGVNELIISHTILAKGDYFSGQKIVDALVKAGLSFGEMNIFHFPGDENAKTFALFSVANVVEPGTFDPENAKAMKTPGISIFMRLPTRMDNHKAYDKFIEVAKLIADDLSGELCDETRSQLTQQAVAYKKEQIKTLNFEIAKAQKLADMGH